jgi:hypothetical protein
MTTETGHEARQRLRAYLSTLDPDTARRALRACVERHNTSNAPQARGTE